MDAVAILNLKTPENLFSSPDNVKKEFINLAKVWHPDHNKDLKAHEVFEHINKLYELAKQNIANHIWETPNILQIRAYDGQKYTIRYKKKHSLEIGNMYIGDTIIAFMFTEQNKDLYQNALKQIKFSYASTRMEEEMCKYLPKIKANIETIDNKYYLIIEKTPDLFLLKDIFNYFNKNIDSKHIAWIINRIYNLACYLDYANITHTDISMDSIFISPQYHSAALLGGWWYASKTETKLIAVPKRTYSLMSPKQLSNKIADKRLDLDLIRALGRELLNEPSSIKLKNSKKTTKEITDWLCSATTGNAIKDYGTWRNEILIKSFGKRKFVTMEVDPTIIYST